MLSRVKSFLWTHRGKVAVTAAVAIVASAYLWYATPATPSDAEAERERRAALLETDEELGSGDREYQKLTLKQGMRSRLLLRVRRHFDVTAKHFFPTLRVKILEVVDISNAIQQIKQLRSAPESDMVAKSTEATLWDQIKISSFVMFLTCAYMIGILAVLLRLQLHILARHAAMYNDEDPNNTSPSEAELKILIDSTFKYVFGDGLVRLVGLLRHRVTTALVDWTVREKVAVQYLEFEEVVSYLRKSVEKDLKAFVEATIIVSSPSTTNTKLGATTIELFSQTADIVESQLFRAVLLEAFDRVFTVFSDDVKTKSFPEIVDSSGSRYKSPPFAILLPQLKATALRYLPKEGVSDLVNEIVGGANISALCSAIIDSEMKTTLRSLPRPNSVSSTTNKYSNSV